MMAGYVLKAAGVLMVFAGSCGVGCSQAADYRLRLQLLEQLRQMILLLKGQILYANAPLSEAFEAVGRRTEGVLSGLFLAVAERIDCQEGETFAEIWKEEAERVGGTKEGQALPREDLEALKKLGEQLGFLDREMQERTLLLYLEELDLQIEQLRLHRQERCRLYTSLGIMGGLILILLLI